jgi:cytochrome c553
MAERKPISKKVRFEVFKRDSFKCQYCGAEAPSVLLNVDHIKPVAEGGTNELMNLIAACSTCNAGKAATPLSDQSTLAKQKAQLDELQERREQLEMLLEWKQGLSELSNETMDKIADYWAQHAKGWYLNEHGKHSLKKWLNQFTTLEIVTAMDTALSQYIELDPKSPEKATSDSIAKAFASVPGICRVNRASKDNPDLKELFYIRGILRKRLYEMGKYCNEWQALEDLKAARSWDIPLERLRDIALSCRNWSEFQYMITEVIDEYRAREGA